jgi:hypothetical protein
MAKVRPRKGSSKPHRPDSIRAPAGALPAVRLTARKSLDSEPLKAGFRGPATGCFFTASPSKGPGVPPRVRGFELA